MTRWVFYRFSARILWAPLTPKGEPWLSDECKRQVRNHYAVDPALDCNSACRWGSRSFSTHSFACVSGINRALHEIPKLRPRLSFCFIWHLERFLTRQKMPEMDCTFSRIPMLTPCRLREWEITGDTWFLQNWKSPVTDGWSPSLPIGYPSSKCELIK